MNDALKALADALAQAEVALKAAEQKEAGLYLACYGVIRHDAGPHARAEHFDALGAFADLKSAYETTSKKLWSAAGDANATKAVKDYYPSAIDAAQKAADAAAK